MSARSAGSVLVLTAGALAPSAALAGYVGVDGGPCDYASVQEAIDAASSGAVLRVAEGVHLDPGFVVDRQLIIRRGDASCQDGGTTNATLDFGGLGRGEVAAGVALSLQQVNLTAGSGVNGGALAIGDGGEAWLTDVSITASNATLGGAVYVGAGAYLFVVNGDLADNLADQGGAIYADTDAYVLLTTTGASDTLLADNSAAQGGGVFCDSCTLSVAPGVGGTGAIYLEGNQAGATSADYGGAIALVNGDGAITDAHFSYNNASSGGAVFLSTPSSITISESSFTANSASDGGGVAILSSGPQTISDTLFSGNGADFGGGLFVSGSDELTLDQVSFTTNLASEDGGGVYASSTAIEAEDCIFTGNYATLGGGMLLEGEDTVATYIRRATFDGNTATGGSSGSAIDVRDDGQVLTLSNSLVHSGVSPTSPGAAVVAQYSADLVIYDSTIANNQRWGVALLTGSTANFAGSIVWTNASGGVTGSASGTCNDTQGSALSGTLNISASPKFTAPGSDNYTLQSTSPARNACAAHPGTALNGVDRSVGSSDMGAYDH